MAAKSKLMGWGIALGAGLGTVAGVMVGHIAIWLGAGLALGILIGSTVRRRQMECPQCAQIHRAHEVRRAL